MFRAFRKYKDEQEGIKKTYDDAIENQVPLEKEVYKITEVKEVAPEETRTLEKPEEGTDVEIKKEDKNSEERREKRRRERKERRRAERRRAERRRERKERRETRRDRRSEERREARERREERRDRRRINYQII